MIKKIYNKIRQIDRLEGLVKSQVETNEEIFNALNFHTAINGKSWIKETGFYPGGWAADYKMLTYLFRILNDFMPDRVLEFGMGETTKMLSAYVTKHNREAKISTVEHNEEWIQFFSSKTRNLDGINIVKVEMLKKSIKGHETNYYTNLIPQISNFGKFDLFVVDGPIGSENYSRYNVCEIAENDLLAEKFIILLDDAQREGEKETIADLEEIFKNKGIKYRTAYIHSTKKDIYTIFSNEYRFLSSV